MHVLTVVGARPQFVKAFPVSCALADDHTETLVHTGQHYDRELSDVFFEELDVPEPDHHLGVGSAPPGRQIGRIMTELETIVEAVDPDVLLTYGDTNSTLAAANVGAHAPTLLAHVEAGLRSDNRSMPEEINRVLTDHAADLLFAPTERAVRRLRHEGLEMGVFRTGDVMVDALHWARDVAEDTSTILDRLGLQSDEYLVATVHRQSNTDDADRLRRIIDTLGERSEPVVFPAHPRTVDRLEGMDALEWAQGRVRVIDPVGYLDFIHLLRNAAGVVTDSGGIQKEAFLLDTPCVTLRAETEWPETVEAGWNTLVGSEPAAIHAGIDDRKLPGLKPQPFGDGSAAAQIVAHLQHAVHDDTVIARSPVDGVRADHDYPRGN